MNYPCLKCPDRTSHCQTQNGQDNCERLQEWLEELWLMEAESPEANEEDEYVFLGGLAE